MQGLMQNQPLLISSLIEFAAPLPRHDRNRVRAGWKAIFTATTWADAAARRAKQLAKRWMRWGWPTVPGWPRIAWNGYRHLEMYYGVSGSGRVLHTINPRLHLEQVAWIVNHAEDEVLCFDMSFLPLVQAVHRHVPHGASTGWRCAMPTSCRPTAASPAWSATKPGLPPTMAATTGPSLMRTPLPACATPAAPRATPRGRCTATAPAPCTPMPPLCPDSMGLSARDVILPVVPMFHVNAWGIPYTAAQVGAKLVLPGPALDGKSLYELIEAEGVTFAAGVPTIWQMLLGHVQPQRLQFSSFKRTVIGGAACPPAMIAAFEDDFGVQVLHAWGMTETSPLGAVCSFKAGQMALPKEERRKISAKQGRAIYGVEMKIVGGDGRDQPWDGKAYGDLLVRGPWILQQYYKGESPLVVDEAGLGWLPTGDVATIDADGFMQITDRSKDVIKSGGEWISSIDIENIAMGHPAVAMAACVGMPHPKWDERPIVVVATKPGASVTREELLAFYEGKLAKWQIPDDVVFVDAIPLGATGKMLKTKLREVLVGYQLPDLR